MAASQLAASLLGEIAPPRVRAGAALSPPLAWGPQERAVLAPALDQAERLLQEHFAASNLAVELHQSLLDLVVAGTGALLAEAAPPGGPSALRFQSVPLAELALAPGEEGDIGAVFRRRVLSVQAAARRWPAAAFLMHGEDRDGGTVAAVESVRPEGAGWLYDVFLDGEGGGAPLHLVSARLSASPILVFRWTRAHGDLWGRSPVMNALPEIRTANRVVDLSLRNAALAAVGVWQLDDDGVLDPARIRLEPGAILPRAPGARGLAPLETGRGFDLSQLMLSDLRERIRAALLSDRLGVPPGRAGRTATEVLARASDDARLLGAHYGRLAAELVSPLALRALQLLARAGLMPAPLAEAGFKEGLLPEGVALRHRAPLAQLQAQRDSANFFLFLERLFSLGGAAAEAVDMERAVAHAAELLGVPQGLLRVPAAPPTPAAPEASAVMFPRQRNGESHEPRDPTD